MTALARSLFLIVGAGVAAMTLSSGAHAQGAAPTCRFSIAILHPNDVCRKSAEMFQFIAPQVGSALTGGNHILGQGSAVGGASAQTVSFKVTALSAHGPRNAVPVGIDDGEQASDFGNQPATIAVASADVALGVLPGIPYALTNVLGVDLLAGITYIPPTGSGTWKVKSRQALAVNYGVRVGILQESALVPGMGLSFMRKQLPRYDISYFTGNDTLGTVNTKVKANSFRATLSKGYGFFGFLVGAGHDRFESIADIEAVVNETVDGTPQRVTMSLPLVAQRVSRNTVFANLSVGMRFARFTAEYGVSSGSKQETLNSFGGRNVNGGSQYGSAGLGFRF